MDREAVGRWLTAYVEAWKTYDPARIAALFSDDVSYRYHPYDEPTQGRDAVVVTGTTSYRAEPGGQVDRIYDNCFVIGFDSGGRCREFTEWYMRRP